MESKNLHPAWGILQKNTACKAIVFYLYFCKMFNC